MKIKHFKNQKCCFDINLPEKDEYSFSVLVRILKSECRLTITDSKYFIVCHSKHPYPVWIWLSPNASTDTFEQVYSILKKEFFFDKSFRFNLDYDFANYLIKRAENDNITFKISTNMFSYRCIAPIPPRKKPAGSVVCASKDDIDLAVEYMIRFNDEVAIEHKSIDDCKAKVMELITAERLFFWCDENGEKSAMASYVISENKGAVGNVFTRHDKRKLGYAANLVYYITLMILKKDKIPILYTDADYCASNACYEGIGYVKMSSLCTVEQI